MRIFKLLMLSALLLPVCFSGMAQFKQVATSSSFDEPVGGVAKIMVKADGGAMFVRVPFKDDPIDVRVFDPAHKQIATTSFSASYGKLKEISLEGFFEIGGDGVLMISGYNDKVPTLYRLVIDGQTGKLKSEEKLAELKKLSFGMGYAVAFGGMSLPDFNVAKDPNSDNYAVALFNSFESERSKRIEIIAYGKDNKETARAYYSSPEEKFKYLDFVGMTVIGAEKVSVLVSAYNTASSGGKERQMILANLDKGASQVSFNELNFPKDSLLENGLVRYNPITKKIVVVAKLYKKKSKDARMYIGFVDPFTKKNEEVMSGYITQTLIDKSKAIFGKKYDYYGTPLQLHINNDGGFSVVYEEIRVVSSSQSSHVELGNIVAATYNRKGDPVSNYFIPKDFWIDSKGTLTYGSGFANEYKKSAYINGANKSYVLINDHRKNIERLEKEKEPAQVQTVGGTDAFYFTLTGSDPVPQRKYLFGESDEKADRNLSPFGISAYDSKNDLFVVLKLEKSGRDKSVSVVWLKPQ